MFFSSIMHIKYSNYCLSGSDDSIFLRKCQNKSIARDSRTGQAWNFMPVALVLALLPPQMFPIDCNIFQWMFPFESENGLAFSKMKCQA